MGAVGQPVHLITHWHVGGFGPEAVQLVTEQLGGGASR
jgi:hypothetical protein